MKARAISILTVAILLGLNVPAGAQDTGLEGPPLQENEKPDRPPPTTGALPFEDPTIEPPRDEDLRIEETPDAELAREADEPEKPVAEPAESHAPQEDEGPNVKVVYDEVFLLSVDDWFVLTLGGLVQARYTLNYRTEPPTDTVTLVREKEFTQGFDVSRARFQLGIGLTEFVALFMRVGVVAGGSFSIQRAFIDLKWKYFRIRGGVFMSDTIAESIVGPIDLYFVDYSIVENVYSPGSSNGVMFTYLRDRFSINLAYTDGLRTGFSEIRDPVNADYAFTVRAQYAWGEAGLAGFNRLTTRRGAPFGIRLGGALHYQDGGRTQGSLPAKIAIGTIDLSVRGSGWSLLLSGVVGEDATESTTTNEAGQIQGGGVTLMGGYFVTEKVQIFAQYNIVTKPKIQGTLPPAVIDEILGPPSNFQAFGVGFSYFVIPERDNVKLSSDFLYFLGHETGSPVPSSPLNSIQVNDAGSQFAWRIQLSARF